MSLKKTKKEKVEESHQSSTPPDNTIDNKEAETKKEEQELPYLDPYNKELYYKIYLPDLFADILLIVFSFFISHELFSDSGLFTHLKTWHVSAMYCIVTLTIPWYLGYIYVHNKAYYEKGILKFILWVFIIMVFMILVNLVRLVFQMDGIVQKDFMGTTPGFTAVFAMFLLVLGPMMCIGGGMSANEELQQDKGPNGRYDPYNVKATGAFVIVILAVAFMIYFVGLFPEGSSAWVVVLGYLGGPLAAVIVYAIYIYFMTLLDKIGVYKYIKFFAQNAFPFFIISVLVFWSGVSIHFMVNDFANSAGKLSRGGVLFSLCISGLIPFRICMMFNAPLRLINIIIGIISLGYFIFQMMLLTIR